MVRNWFSHAAGVVLALGLVLCLPGLAAAQTISQPVATNSTGLAAGLGQSFTAPSTGAINQIAVRTRSSNATTLRIYNGANGSGVAGSSAGAAYTQAVTLTDTGSNTAGYTVITLTTPFPVVSGQTYSIVFDSSAVAFSLTNPYAGGAAIDNFGTVVGPPDWAFEIYQTAPVPTMSEWAMILFGLLMAGGAAVYLQRRRIAA
ncbi:IPTL-CTERM sorting domain-containing protein [Brevundimonas sp.]|uniref:IPTL-CTERM sorting domain-containing protein n=1 Tax=Brevundimonas sp. TaxID=1871086 RepID=UPI002FD89991